jgi:hypothetical protein
MHVIAVTQVTIDLPPSLRAEADVREPAQQMPKGAEPRFVQKGFHTGS